MAQIALRNLFLSKLNQRQTTDENDVSDLVASIRETQGPLQQLVVVPAGKGEKRGTFGVVAGGRRLAALKKLAADPTITAFSQDTEIDCKVITREEAVLASIAENTQRQELHPVEMFRAFQVLIDSGKSIEDTAAAFGVTPAVVRRYLKLASVAPELLELALQGDISIEQLMALSLCDDPAVQLAVWSNAPSYARSAEQLRSRITQDETRADRDRRMKYVGIDAYQQAGGRLRIDLFADHAGYIMDAAVLDALVVQKMADTAEAERAAGWQHVVTVTDPQFSIHSDTMRVHAVRREPTDEEAEQLAALSKQMDRIETDLNDCEHDETAAALEKDYEAVSAAIEKIENTLHDYSDQQKHAAGVILYLDANGVPQIAHGHVLTDDEDRCEALRALRRTTAEPAAGSAAAAPKAAHSERLTLQLSSHRSAVAQALVANDPRLAVIAALLSLVPRTFRTLAHQHTAVGTLNGSATTDQLRTHCPDADHAPAFNTLLAIEAQWRDRLVSVAESDDEQALLHWLAAQSQDDLLSLLSFCVASTIDLTSRAEAKVPAKAFGALIGLDMRQWWKPTASSYFQHVSKTVIAEAVNEATGAPLAKADALKKAEAAALAETAVAGSGWLPVMLRQA